MGLERDVCEVWAHTKCEKIAKDEYKVFEKKHSPFSWIWKKQCREIDFLAKFETVENTMVMVTKEMKEMKDLTVDRKSREEHGMESKGDGEERGGTSKWNDDGSIPENGDGNKRDKIYHWEHKTRNKKGESRARWNEKNDRSRRIKEERRNAEKRMNEIMRGKPEIGGKQLEEVYKGKW